MIPPRISLGIFPTPLHRLDNVSRDLGLDVWIKRDDLSGLAMGGNKVRKLEFLMAEALHAKADIVVTCGASHSNFIRLLAAACARCGPACAAAVMELPFEDAPPEGKRLLAGQGNAMLSELLGAEIRAAPDGSWEELYAEAERLALRHEKEGKTVYRIPIGGSSAAGAYGFYVAADEIHSTSQIFDWIVVATSSGSTQTGLAFGFAGTTTRVLGIASDPEPGMVHDLAALGTQLSRLLPSPILLRAEDFDVNLAFVGPGYGIPSEAGMEAIEYLARREGILLDPIYSGKAFAGLLSLARDNRITGRILFWHTGGIPNLFAVSNHVPPA